MRLFKNTVLIQQQMSKFISMQQVNTETVHKNTAFLMVVDIKPCLGPNWMAHSGLKTLDAVCVIFCTKSYFSAKLVTAKLVICVSQHQVVSTKWGTN